MSTSTTHQQSLVDAGSETRPPMLERVQRMQTEDDLRGDEMLYYEADIEAMNLIIISIPNDIYNFMDACTTAKAMWKRFVAEPGEALVLYVTQVRLVKRLTEDTFDDLFDYLQQFEKLVNASGVKKLEKSNDPLALVAHTGSSSRNTTPYYVTHPLSMVDYDDDYQRDVVQTNYEDPLTSAILLLARAITQNFSHPTNNSLRTSSNTRNQAIVQGDRVNIQSKNSSNNDRNTRRAYIQKEVVEGTNDEARVILTDEQNDFLFADASRMEDIKELSANMCLMARIQPANTNSDVWLSYDYAFLSEIQTPSTSNNQEQKYPNQPKIINKIIGDDQIDRNFIFDEPNGNVNSGSVENDNNVHDLYALE
ncbi:hypothetical protein Tco_1193797 [Tanacetum coccineum]